jgi:VCBS repeat-containing protein
MVDAGGLMSLATVTITIQGSNDTPESYDDFGYALESGGVFNGSLGANATGNVLSNDTDVDSMSNGETKMVTGVATGAVSSSVGSVESPVDGLYGSITIGPDGAYTYVIDESNTAVQELRVSGQTLADVFTYTVTDAGGLTNSSQVTITIRGKNDNPVGNPDFATAVEAGGTDNGTIGSNAVGNVLVNDTDSDSVSEGETQAVLGVIAGVASNPVGLVGTEVAGLYGAITIQSDGSYMYVIDDANPSVQALRLSTDTLTDVFTYTVVDAGGLVDSSQVTITLQGSNDTPVAITSTVLSVNENSANGAWVGQLFMDDVDVGDAATYSLVDDAQGRFEIDAVSGVLRVKDGGRVDHESTARHELVVRATDTEGLSVEVAFDVQILNVNEKPIGGMDHYTLTYIDRLTVAGPGVIENDSDPEGDAVSARLISGPLLGVLSFNSDGSFVYQPDGAFVGTVSFVYELSDRVLASDWVTVEIVIGLPTTLPGVSGGTGSNASSGVNDSQIDSSQSFSTGNNRTSRDLDVGVSTGTLAESGAAGKGLGTNVEIGGAVILQNAVVAETILGTDGDRVEIAGYSSELFNKELNAAIVIGGSDTQVLTTLLAVSPRYHSAASEREEERSSMRWADEYRSGGPASRNHGNHEADATVEFHTSTVVQTLIGTGMMLWLAQGFQVAATVVTAAPVWTGLDPVTLTVGLEHKGDKKGAVNAAEKMFDK